MKEKQSPFCDIFTLDIKTSLFVKPKERGVTVKYMRSNKNILGKNFFLNFSKCYF